MASLLPETTVEELDRRFENRFRQLPKTHRLALATAALEGEVTHARLNSITPEHPRDVTMVLRALVEEGFLESVGATRATRYFLPGRRPTSDQEVLEGVAGSGDLASSSGDLTSSFGDLAANSEDSRTESKKWEKAREISKPIREAGRSPRSEVKHAILAICSLGYFSQRQLAELLGRTEDTIRQDYVAGMVKRGELRPKYPSATHPKQAYRTAEEAESRHRSEADLAAAINRDDI